MISHYRKVVSLDGREMKAMKRRNEEAEQSGWGEEVRVKVSQGWCRRSTSGDTGEAEEDGRCRREMSEIKIRCAKI